MCGIFGLLVQPSAGWSADRVEDAARRLFLLSESRGREAAGLAVRRDGLLRVYREPLAASAMLRTSEYRAFTAEAMGTGPVEQPVLLIGHSRLVTNGLQAVSTNNQPVAKDGVVAVHNGIVVNDAALWQKHLGLKRCFDVDTEVILSLLRENMSAAALPQAISGLFDEIEGAASLGLLFEDHDGLLLASNNGSLYVWTDGAGLVAFTSEKYTLEAFVEQVVGVKSPVVERVGPWAWSWFDASTTPVLEIVRWREANATAPEIRQPSATARIVDLDARENEARNRLRRCTRCVLPETMPFIDFDSAGVCNYCRTHVRKTYPERHETDAFLAPYRRRDGRPDCILALSGGRDSTYGLHLLVEEFGMNPVAYTYDWGLVTDLARRNSSRICGKLGIEHIIVSADIKAKRANVRRNIEAWIRRPRLGMIPLFMAGDKLYFYHANRLAQQMDVPLVVFCGNHLEKTRFKTGFAGVREGEGRLYDMTKAQKMALAAYYGGQFLSNPRYLNRSLLDTARSYVASYMSRHEYMFFYNHVPWHEDKIMDLLRREYDWEAAADTESTWRIGDGTAAFYNYIYYTVAGFTENDTFRSNQIREGLIGREEALRLVQRDNQPRFRSMVEYSQMIGFDLDDAVRAIHRMPRLYAID